MRQQFRVPSDPYNRVSETRYDDKDKRMSNGIQPTLTMGHSRKGSQGLFSFRVRIQKTREEGSRDVGLKGNPERKSEQAGQELLVHT